eukprot:gnl/TRDRNA2_/TRDRNA2_130244_c0_seq1.p1 gnl/TRDRNA2_/TRDRNA2_130244_c0~~gnl/TRDRNA2_/TRDRNA2_130244_c0_seq1.p1  ORF type:complete len:603 (+),score=59.25 gnl/TRDRNA2_/TRDRNA2_130244_c0_seq1:164-1972(+)
MSSAGVAGCLGGMSAAGPSGGRSRSDLPYRPPGHGSSMAAAAGRSMMVHNSGANSRPASVDAPAAAAQAQIMSSPARGGSRGTQRMPDLSGLGMDPSSPDSLSELLGMHGAGGAGSRPSSIGPGKGKRGSGNPPAFPSGPVSPGYGGPQQRWTPGRSPSHDEEGRGAKPPRAPSAGAPGGVNSVLSGTFAAAGQRSRPNSRPPVEKPPTHGGSPQRKISGALSSGAAVIDMASMERGREIITCEVGNGRMPSAGNQTSVRRHEEPPSPHRVPYAAPPSPHGQGLALSSSLMPVAPAALPTPTAMQSVPSQSVSSTAPPPWGCPSSGRSTSFTSMWSDPNEEFRPYMEDGHKVLDPLPLPARNGSKESWGYFGVYDGHGGRNEVDYCEAKLHEVVLAELRNLPAGKDPSSALVAAFQKIDGQLAMLGAWNSGCTCTVAIAHRSSNGLKLHVANVGDSRAVVCGGGGFRRLTIDHRAVDPEEARRVVQDGGIVRHGRVGGQLSVSRSLGDHNLKSSGLSCIPDVCTCDAGSYRALVIASDGLWDAIEDEEAGRVVEECTERARQQVSDPKSVADLLRDTCARTLVERAKEKGSRDNILCLVVFF